MFCCTIVTDAMYTTFAYVYRIEFEESTQESHGGLIPEHHVYWITEEGYHCWNCNWNRKNDKQETETEKLKKWNETETGKFLLIT